LVRNQRDESHEFVKSMRITSGGSGENAVTVANATNNVTISNVAPAAVGTATISRWLVMYIDGIAYYIPMWT